MIYPSSRFTGQGALQRLPSGSNSNVSSHRSTSLNYATSHASTHQSIANYPLPKQAIPSSNSNGVSLKRPSDGMTVLKITKTGKLQARRFAITANRRTVLVTHGSAFRVKSIRGLWHALQNSGGGGGGGGGGGHGSGDHHSSTNNSSSGHNNHNRAIALHKVDRLQRGNCPTTRVRRARQPDVNPTPEHKELLKKHRTLSLVFEKTSSSNHSNNNGDYDSAHHPCESLDLVVADADDLEQLYHCLEALVALHHKERQYQTREFQIFVHHWTELGKLYDSTMSQAEWIQLAERLGLSASLPKQKLHAIWKEWGDELLPQGRGRSGSSGQGSSSQSSRKQASHDHLTFSQTAVILEHARRIVPSWPDDPLEDLWHQLMENDPVPAVAVDDSASYDSYELNVLSNQAVNEESISTVAFLAFLRAQQHEMRWTMDAVTDLVHRLNRMESTSSTAYAVAKPPMAGSDRAVAAATERLTAHNTSLNESGGMLGDAMAPDDRLSKTRFLDYLKSDLNDLLKVDDDMDLIQPLSNYYIATSHATFLIDPDHNDFWGGQNRRSSPRASSNGLPPSEVDDQTFLGALWRGVRCLEVMVYDDHNHIEPMIQRTEDSNVSVRFQFCLDAIRYFLKSEPDCCPVLLKIENHCSTNVQLVMAKQIHTTLGSFVFEPTKELNDPFVYLPSPETAKGKVLILGKRPRVAKTGARVMNDDFDEANDVWEIISSPSSIKYFHEEEARGEHKGVVIGMDVHGPIRSTDITATARNPTEMWQRAEKEAERALTEASETKAKAKQLEELAQKKEDEALSMTHKAGVGPEKVKQTQQRGRRGRETPTAAYQPEYDERPIVEEKSAKEEGVEINDVLSDIVESERQAYSAAANMAIAAANNALKHKKALVMAEEHLTSAEENLRNARDRHEQLVEASKKARSEATAHREHADAAAARVYKVRELVRSNEEVSSSAETVVVTALTEAKISEKRASDAEARAARAVVNAQKDRARSDEECRKEEELERKVNEILTRCRDSSKAVKAARETLDQAANDLERCNEEVRLIEKSYHYKKEVENGVTPTSRIGGSSTMVDKLAEKSSERDTLRNKMKEAAALVSNAEAERSKHQKDFEEYNHVLKLQTDLATKVRKVADRSAHVAEELAEHAEEEREAANLRHVARQRAEANVQSRGSSKESMQTQLQEAERAAAEAANLALESRRKADTIAKEAENSRDTKKLQQIVEERRWGCDEARSYYEFALSDKEQKDAHMLREKRKFDMTNQMRRTAKNGVGSEVDRLKTQHFFQQEAIVSYDQAAVLRQEAEEARRLAKKAAESSDIKSQIAKKAREYKAKMDLVSEIPPSLAGLTFFHSLRHLHWEKSQTLSNAHYHSVAHHVLQRMVQTQAKYQLENFRKFTAKHMFRVFPSWQDLKEKRISNYNPIMPWMLGCQLVAMNYSLPDENLLIAEGFFRRHGSCGYVLKSNQLNSSEESFHRWNIKIHGAYHIPKVSQRRNPGKLMVRLAVYSGDLKVQPFVFTLSNGVRIGNDVVFVDRNSCTIDVVNSWIAMVTFTVWEQHNNGADFVAGAGIPVSGFQQGYRSVALFDENHCRMNAYRFASLVVHATKL